MKTSTDDERYHEMLVETLTRQQARDAPRPLPVPKALPPRSALKVEKEPLPRTRIERQALDQWADDGGFVPPVIDLAERRRAGDRRRAAMARAEADAVARQKALRVPPPIARRVEVESPYGRQYVDERGIRQNRPDKVERIVDTIALMLARRQLDARQETAARKVQSAFEMAPASYRCALAAGDGGGQINASPTERQLWAGGVLNEVRSLLGQRDTKVVLLVCGQGFTIEQVTRSFFAVPDHRKPDKRDALEIGRRLRGGLTDLADHWWPERRTIRVVASADARPSVDATQRPGENGAREVPKGRAAHASRKGVHRDGRKHA